MFKMKRSFFYIIGFLGLALGLNLIFINATNVNTTTSEVVSIPRPPNGIPTNAIYLGKGANSIAWLSSDGATVYKQVIGGQLIADQLLTAHNYLSKIYGSDFIPPLRKITNDILAQDYVEGWSYKDIKDPDLKERLMDKMTGVSSDAGIRFSQGVSETELQFPKGMKPGDSVLQVPLKIGGAENNSVVMLDDNKLNFKLNKDGRLVWFDPIAIFTPAKDKTGAVYEAQPKISFSLTNPTVQRPSPPVSSGSEYLKNLEADVNDLLDLFWGDNRPPVPNHKPSDPLSKMMRDAVTEALIDGKPQVSISDPKSSNSVTLENKVEAVSSSPLNKYAGRASATAAILEGLAAIQTASADIKKAAGKPSEQQKIINNLVAKANGNIAVIGVGIVGVGVAIYFLPKLAPAIVASGAMVGVATLPMSIDSLTEPGKSEQVAKAVTDPVSTVSTSIKVIQAEFRLASDTLKNIFGFMNYVVDQTSALFQSNGDSNKSSAIVASKSVANSSAVEQQKYVARASDFESNHESAASPPNLNKSPTMATTYAGPANSNVSISVPYVPPDLTGTSGVKINISSAQSTNLLAGLASGVGVGNFQLGGGATTPTSNNTVSGAVGTVGALSNTSSAISGSGYSNTANGQSGVSGDGWKSPFVYDPVEKAWYTYTGHKLPAGVEIQEVHLDSTDKNSTVLYYKWQNNGVSETVPGRIGEATFNQTFNFWCANCSLSDSNGGSLPGGLKWNW